MINFEFFWVLFLLPLPFLIKPKPSSDQSQDLLFLYGFECKKNNTGIKRLNKLFLWLIWFFLILAASRPQWTGEPVEIETQGRDIIVAVDLSGSMSVKDMKINNDFFDRLTAIKYFMSDFLLKREGDRIGLVLFGEDAYVQAPLTSDIKTVVRFLNDSQIEMVGKTTAIGSALALSTKRFTDIGNSNRVVILLSDGRNTSGSLSMDQALEYAKYNKVKVYTIGIGADSIEQKTIFGKVEVPVESDLDEESLKKISAETGGVYYRVKNTEGLKNVYDNIESLEPIRSESKFYRPKIEYFGIPLFIAFILSFCFILFDFFRFSSKD